MTCELRQEIDSHFLPEPPKHLAVAVSGGGDSIALLHLIKPFAEQHGIPLCCVTVDHGLRPEAAQEAICVARICKGLGISHTTLNWSGWDGQGNVQSAARDARYALIGAWAQDRGVEEVALGHTQDDQAETFVMRLARGSGVDGLSAMAARRQHGGVTWGRPLLGVRRAALRAYLSAKGIDWIDDPSNEDTSFERVRTRQALQTLGDLGLDTQVLVQVAENMKDAQDALSRQTRNCASQIVTATAGALRVDWTALDAEPKEIRRRLIIGCLKWVGGASYPPRRAALANTMQSVSDDGAATLDGCLLRLHRDTLWISREYKAVHALKVSVTELWDKRWRVSGGAVKPSDYVAALGDAGLRECENWRETALPRDVLKVTPAIWREGGHLVAAPLVNPSGAWQADTECGLPSF